MEDINRRNRSVGAAVDVHVVNVVDVVDNVLGDISVHFEIMEQ